MSLILYAVAEGMRLRAAASSNAGPEAVGCIHGYPAVVVAGGSQGSRPSAPVVECNRLAAGAGVRTGIPLSQAKRLCPDLYVFHLSDDDPQLQLLAGDFRRDFYNVTPWIEVDGVTALFCRIDLPYRRGREGKGYWKGRAGLELQQGGMTRLQPANGTGPWPQPANGSGSDPHLARAPGRGGAGIDPAGIDAVISELQPVAVACPGWASRVTIGVAPTRFEAKLLVQLVMQADSPAAPGSSWSPGPASLRGRLGQGKATPLSGNLTGKTVPVRVVSHGRLRLILPPAPASPAMAAGLAAAGASRQGGAGPAAPVALHAGRNRARAPSSRPGSAAGGDSWLHGVPVTGLWPLPPAAISRLQRLGLRTLGDVAAVGEAALADQLGDDGRRAWELSQGIDMTPVVVNYPPREVAESVVLPPGAGANVLDLEQVAARAATVLAGRLLRAGEGAGMLELTIEGEHGHRLSAVRAFPAATARPAALAEAARGLAREALQQAARAAGARPPAPVAAPQVQLAAAGKLHLRARGLVPLPVEQQSLWDGASSRAQTAVRKKRLMDLITQLRKRFPDAAARTGRHLIRPRRERLLSYWDPFRFGWHCFDAPD